MSFRLSKTRPTRALTNPATCLVRLLHPAIPQPLVGGRLARNIKRRRVRPLYPAVFVPPR